MRLKDKVCIVTGGGSGIGRATSALFASEGAKVVVVDVDEAAGRSACEEIGGIFVKADVSSLSDAQRAVACAVETHGRLDVLFNNAGISAVGDVTETGPEEWDHVFSVNVRGVYNMNHVAVPVMIRQESGVIINMSSCVAEIGLARRAAYTASKGAVLALTRAMAADHSRQGVRVVALLPGTVYTPFVEGFLRKHFTDTMDEALSDLKRRQLNGELMMPKDVAQAALFLASDEARFALGTALVIDGGVSEAKVF